MVTSYKNIATVFYKSYKINEHAAKRDIEKGLSLDLQDKGFFEVSLPLSFPSGFRSHSHPLLLFSLSSLWSEEVVKSTPEGLRRCIKILSLSS